MTLFAVIKFDNEHHKDNEHTKMLGPFPTSDAATLWAENNLKFWHVVRLDNTPSSAIRVRPAAA